MSFAGVRRGEGPDCGPVGRVGRFAKADEGSLTIFGLFIFLIILMVAGMAVDLMRYERLRVQLQNTADRAVLAACSLRQPKNRQQVVQDYFEREGLEEYLGDVNVQADENLCEISLTASAPVPTIFMGLVGVDELVAQSASVAEERLTEVEVALVLDISGSMGGRKMQNLHTAGREFIDTLFENSDPGQVSVSLIPYETQVNPGPTLGALYNIRNSNPWSYCVDFEPADFETPELSQTRPIDGTGHFSVSGAATPTRATCPTRTGAPIVPMSGDPVLLRTRIGELAAGGMTSIETGVKWAAALLDPGTRPVIDDLIAEGEVDAGFSGRPHDYDDPAVLKVMVIMTDGENTTETRLRDDAKRGPSHVFLSEDDNMVSILHPGRPAPNFFVPHLNIWQNTPWSSTPGKVRQMHWQEVWNSIGVSQYVVNYVAAPAGVFTRSTWWEEYNQLMNTWMPKIQGNQKNERLEEICNRVREQDVVVFTVAFEAPNNGVAAMQLCASSPAHFFDVNGTDISEAFRTIAGTIHQLRLTQ